MIRMIMMSVANVSTVPAQDLPDSPESRMNRPGTGTGNWAFACARRADDRGR
jgi:4-alpha-glucanotransferase